MFQDFFEHGQIQRAGCLYPTVNFGGSFQSIAAVRIRGKTGRRRGFLSVVININLRSRQFEITGQDELFQLYLFIFILHILKNRHYEGDPEMPKLQTEQFTVDLRRIFESAAVHEIRHLFLFEIVDHADRKRFENRMDKTPEMPVFRDGPGRLPGDIRIRLYVLVNFFHTVQIE